MKFSVNLAQYYTNFDIKSLPHDELVRRIGAQLGAVEDTVDYAPRYDGIVVARVVSCEKHPNADTLSVCLIDDGSVVKDVERDPDGYVQVVCGAPNVRGTLVVAWIPPGIVVPSTVDKDPFTLEVREIRGIKSHGMLASPAELGISDNHDGLLEIVAEDVGEDLMKPGTPLKYLYGLDDFVIDLENKMFTHRPDCFGNIGVAREIAAIMGMSHEDPDWYWKIPQFESATTLELGAPVHLPSTVRRFMTVAMSGVTIGPSPMWMQASLRRVGMNPIHNVVDVTNYVMHLTAQPMHAFDYDKIKALSKTTPSIFPRYAKKGEQLTLLNGKTIELTEEDIVIATDIKPVALAGVMGGAETEVDEETKNILIECATFDMYSIRRTSMRHGLFTEAATRYTKGQSPLQNDRVLQYAMKLLGEVSGAVQASQVIDQRSFPDAEYDNQSVCDSLRIRADFINSRLGTSLTNEAICEILRRVHFTAYIEKDDFVNVTPPFWRTDIHIAEDVVEEVGRLYGFDTLPVLLPPRLSKPTLRNVMLDFKDALRQKLAAAGANEVLTYSFVHGDLLRKAGIDPDKHAYHIRNALSPDLQYYRTSLLLGLLEKVYPNIRSDLVRSDDNQFALFEIGRVHLKGRTDEDGLPKAFERLAFVFSADDKTAKRLHGNRAYYQARKYLVMLLGNSFCLEPLVRDKDPLTTIFQPGRSALVMVGGRACGAIGEFTSTISRSLKLPTFTAGFELDLEQVCGSLPDHTYEPLLPQPKTQQDITLEVTGKNTYQSVYNELWNALTVFAAERNYTVTLGLRDIYRKAGTDGLRFTFRIWLQHPQRSRTTDEVNDVLGAVAARLLASIGAIWV